MEVIVIVGLYVLAAIGLGVVLGAGGTSFALALRRKAFLAAFQADASFVDHLLHDGKFLAALFDALTTILLFIVGTYFPQYDEATKVVWGALQPVFLLIIAEVSQVEAQIAGLKDVLKEAKHE